jgi:hypothetical protein
MHVEHEYFRCGAWTYIAALDVHRARVFGRAPFDRLVEQVMTRPPYNDARRVFWRLAASKKQATSREAQA